MWLPQLPVDSYGHHAEEGHSHVSVEEEWKHLAERVTEHPGLVDVAGRSERQVDAAEQEVRHAQADDECRGRMVT